MNKEAVKAIIRLLVTLILTINSILTANGKNPIPFDESAFTETATYIVNHPDLRLTPKRSELVKAQID